MSSELINLSWKILEHKCLYYMFNDPILEDHEYDILERRYELLCKESGVDPTASDMIGFDMRRESCQLVIEKIRRKRGY